MRGADVLTTKRRYGVGLMSGVTWVVADSSGDCSVTDASGRDMVSGGGDDDNVDDEDSLSDKS